MKMRSPSSGVFGAALLLLLGTAAVVPASAQGVRITNTPAPGTIGIPYSFQFTATGADSYQFFWNCGILCVDPVPGLSLSQSGLITGTPTTVGTFTIFVIANDANNLANTSGPVQMSVHIGLQPLTINTTSVSDGTRGASYSVSLSASGGAGNYTWSLISGALPAGLLVNPAGSIGTAINSNAVTQQYSFALQVKDGAGSVAFARYTMTVFNPALTLSPATLPAGIVNGPYTTAVAASGGTGGPYTYSFAGNPPPGLILNSATGAIIGSPTASGTFKITVGVSDGSAFTPAFPGQNYSVTIYPLITIAPGSIPAGDLGSNYSQTFTAAGGAGPVFTYSITGLPSGMTFNAASGLLSGPIPSGGPFTFAITGRDTLGFTGTQNYTLAVNPALTLSPSTLSSTLVGSNYSQAFTASGGSGSGYSYTFNGNAIPTLNFTGNLLAGTPTKAGSYPFSITVKDSLGYSITVPYTLVVSAPITVQPGAIPSGQAGVAYTPQTFTASGGTGGPYTWSISPNNPFGLTFTPSPTTASLSGTPTSFGTVTVTVTASDGAITGHTDYSLTIAPGTLTLVPSSLPNGAVGTLYPTQIFTAAGGLGNYTFSIIGTQPPGLNLNTNGLPTIPTAAFGGTPTAGGSYSFSVQVSDGSKTAAQSFTLTITNPPITLAPATLTAGILNGAYSQTFVASGGTGGPYTYSISGSTPGLTLNATTGVFSGAPTSVSTYSFTISATDNSQFTPAFQAKPYSITVNPPITISPTTVPNADPSVNYSQTFSASGGSGVPYTYAISAPPPGLSINANTGVLSGPPSAAGTYSFTITAKDSAGLTGTSPSITLTVNPALTLSPQTLSSGQLGAGYSQAFSSTGGSGGYTYTLGGTPPTGLTLTGNVLSGTPTATGTFTFTVTAHDSLGGVATNSYTVTIGNSSIVVQPTTVSSGQLGTFYSQTFSATGGAGSNYTFSIGGPAPFGLNFNPGTATLSGTPTSTGNASITISATDGTLTGQRTYTLTILSSGLTLTPTTSIATGTVGVKYSQTFSASGGQGNYTISLSPPSPAGLSFAANGPTATLSGTPTSSGSFPLVAQVTDGTSTITRNYTLAISASPLSILTTSLPAGTQGTGYGASFSATGGNPPYTWAVQPATALPPGVTLIASGPGAGALTGTPTSPGSFPFTALVTDSLGVTATASLGISVLPAPLSFSTTSPLPPTVSGMKYSVTFGASGGVPPYNFTLNSGPAALTMSGNVLSGTLINNSSAPISYNLTVTLTDSAGGSIGGGFSVTVQPAAAGIILSAGSLSATAASTGSTPPPPEYLSVSSTTQATVPFTVSSDQSWLTVSPPSGNTPATLQVSINQTGLKPGTYTGTITVNGPDGAHTVSYTLKVNSLPAELSAAPTIISFTTDGMSQPAAGSVQVSNVGDGNITFSAHLVNGSSWVSLGGSPTVVTSAAPVSIPVSAVITGLAPGDYRDVIHIDSTAGSADIPVTLLVAGGSTINLVPAGTLYSSRQGQGISDSAQSFQILTTGNTPVAWTASLLSGSGWITLNTTSGTSSADKPGVVSYTVDPSSLATGDFYARIHIDAPTATNAPVDYLLVSTVAPANSPAIPDPSPAGLLFISSPGSLVPPAQIIQVNTSSITPITFSAAANTYNGGSWLSVSPVSGLTSTSAPAQVRATINAAGLATGVYQGGVSFTLQGDPTGVRTVNVTLIVTGSAQSPTLITRGSSPFRHVDLTPAAGCAPSKLVALQTGLVSNFSTPAGWPTPLAIQLADDCGGPVANASVVATFSNGDAPLALQISDSKNAVYSATWNPHGAAAQVTVSARATAPSLQPATAQIIGAISPNKVPILFRHGTIHNLNPQAGAPLAPGTIVQIYGSGLAPTAMQTGLPLPTNVSGTVAIIGGIEAPLYYVSDGQLNAELPLELLGGRQYQILISANGALTLPDSIDVEPVTPGVAAQTDGTIIAQHVDNSYVTTSSPAHPGEVLTIYLAGMGLTDVAVKTGQQSPSDPLAHPNIAPTVTVNGEQAQIGFAGLTPQAVGLYQINFTVPADAPSGTLKLVVTQSNAVSNVSTVAVQAP